MEDEMARTFRVEMTATKIVDVTLEDGDLGPNGTSLEEVAEEVARLNCFVNCEEERVEEVQGWELDIDSVIERPTENVAG
jgi:hypothetical protein